MIQTSKILRYLKVKKAILFGGILILFTRGHSIRNEPDPTKRPDNQFDEL